MTVQQSICADEGDKSLSAAAWIELRDYLEESASLELRALGKAVHDAMFGRSIDLQEIWRTKHLLEAGRAERDQSLLALVAEIAPDESCRKAAKMTVGRLARYQPMPAGHSKPESRERRLIAHCIACGANELSERSIRDRLSGGQTDPIATAQTWPDVISKMEK